MVDKSPTPILLDTAILSRIVSDILETADAPSSKKSACLNKVAGRLAGAKHNWGYLTGSEQPIVAQGLSGLEVIATGAVPAGPEDRSAVPANVYPAAIRAGLVCGFTTMLITGPYGVGLEAGLVEAAEQSGLAPLRIRCPMLHPDEILEYGAVRLQEHVAPRKGEGDITIYDDVDQLSDKGLTALESAVLEIEQQKSGARVMMLTHRAEELLPRLAAHAPALLERARAMRVMPPKVEDIAPPAKPWPTASEWLEEAKEAAAPAVQPAAAPSAEGKAAQEKLLPKDLPETLWTAMHLPLPLLAVAGPTGSGVYRAVEEAILASRKKMHTPQVANPLVGTDYLDKKNPKRLKEDYRPSTDPDTVTVYRDIERVADTHLLAIEFEIMNALLSGSAGRIVLVSSSPELFTRRIRQIAPRLLDRAVSFIIDEPEMPSFPSISAWNKVSEIVKSDPTPGRMALTEAKNILRAGTMSAVHGKPEPRAQVSTLEDLLGFMKGKEGLSQDVIAYMEANASEVDLGIQAKSETPKSWQDAARLAFLYEGALKYGKEPQQAEHLQILRLWISVRLAKHAPGLLAALGIDGSDAQ